MGIHGNLWGQEFMGTGIYGDRNLWGQEFMGTGIYGDRLSIEFMGTGYLLKFMGIYGDRLSIEIHGNSWNLWGQVIY